MSAFRQKTHRCTLYHPRLVAFIADGAGLVVTGTIVGVTDGHPALVTVINLSKGR
jgi:hypothetical protein